MLHWDMTLGENIRKFRKIKGLTQTELAEKLDTTQYVLTNYERGLSSPLARNIPRIAEILGVTLAELYGINDTSDRSVRKGSGTRREAQIQKIFSQLQPADQRALLKQAKGLIKGK